MTESQYLQRSWKAEHPISLFSFKEKSPTIHYLNFRTLEQIRRRSFLVSHSHCRNWQWSQKFKDLTWKMRLLKLAKLKTRQQGTITTVNQRVSVTERTGRRTNPKLINMRSSCQPLSRLMELNRPQVTNLSVIQCLLETLWKCLWQSSQPIRRAGWKPVVWQRRSCVFLSRREAVRTGQMERMEWNYSRPFSAPWKPVSQHHRRERWFHFKPGTVETPAGQEIKDILHGSISWHEADMFRFIIIPMRPTSWSFFLFYMNDSQLLGQWGRVLRKTHVFLFFFRNSLRVLQDSSCSEKAYRVLRIRFQTFDDAFYIALHWWNMFC